MARIRVAGSSGREELVVIGQDFTAASSRLISVTLLFVAKYDYMREDPPPRIKLRADDLLIEAVKWETMIRFFTAPWDACRLMVPLKLGAISAICDRSNELLLGPNNFAFHISVSTEQLTTFKAVFSIDKTCVHISAGHEDDM